MNPALRYGTCKITREKELWEILFWEYVIWLKHRSILNWPYTDEDIPVHSSCLDNKSQRSSISLMRNILTRYIFGFISLASSVGTQRVNPYSDHRASIDKVPSRDGQWSGSASRSSGDGSTNPSHNSKLQELMRQNEKLKWQARLEGSNTSHHWQSRSRHDEEASSPGNSKGKDTSEYIGQSTPGNNYLM